MKFRHLLILILICSAMLFAPAAFGYAGGAEEGDTESIADDYEDTADDGSPRSSFAYKEYSSQNMYRNILRVKMPDVYKKLSPGMNDDETVPIPGTLATCASTDGSQVSDSYIPQGICTADPYWLVTAYDSNKECPSVIYVVDSGAKQLVSTLLLPNKYHVGGIAFDGARVWLTGDTSDKYKGRPFVQYIRYEDILDLHTISDAPEEAVLNTTMFSVITAIDSSSQGMDIDGNYLYVSSSYKGNSPGIKSSFVTKYEISPVLNGAPYLYVEDRELTRIEVPKMNEEIIVKDDLIHINFESSAKRWKNPVIRTDRILAVSKP